MMDGPKQGPASTQFSIFLKTLEGRTKQLRVDSNWTLGTLLAEASRVTDVPSKMFYLTHKGNRLSDAATTVAGYLIQRDDTLHMNLVKGGEPKYDEDAKNTLAVKLRELIAEAGANHPVFVFVGLGSYDNGHTEGEASIIRQQCPKELLETCRAEGIGLRILLIDSGFAATASYPPQIYDIDQNWEKKNPHCYRYRSGDAQLFTFVTDVLSAEYEGTRHTLAGIDLCTEFPTKPGASLVVGNFYSKGAKPHLTKGDPGLLARAGFQAAPCTTHVV